MFVFTILFWRKGRIKLRTGECIGATCNIQVVYCGGIFIDVDRKEMRWQGSVLLMYAFELEGWIVSALIYVLHQYCRLLDQTVYHGLLNVDGTCSTVWVRHDRICAFSLEDLNGTVIILPSNLPLRGKCHGSMFTTYEERLREYHEFNENPHLDISALDLADIPPKPARVCCPFSCPKKLDRTDVETTLELKIGMLNWNREKVNPGKGEAERQIGKGIISVKEIKEGGFSSSGRKRKNRKKLAVEFPVIDVEVAIWIKMWTVVFGLTVSINLLWS